MSEVAQPALLRVRSTYMRRAWCASLVVGSVWLSACGGGQRTVVLRVTAPGDDGLAQPMANAHVRLIPMQTSPVPLPVSSKTLHELKKPLPLCAWTDASGIARIDMRTDMTHVVEVQWPLLSEGSDRIGYVGVLSAQGEDLSESDSLRAMEAQRISVELLTR